MTNKQDPTPAASGLTHIEVLNSILNASYTRRYAITPDAGHTAERSALTAAIEALAAKPAPGVGDESEFGPIGDAELDAAREPRPARPAESVAQGGEGGGDDRLLAALERAGKAESALRRLVDECENDTVPGWEDRMAACILAANTTLSPATSPTPATGSGGDVPEEVSTAMLLLDMGLAFALCHRGFPETRNAVKDLQSHSAIVRDWIKSLAHQAPAGGDAGGA